MMVGVHLRSRMLSEMGRSVMRTYTSDTTCPMSSKISWHTSYAAQQEHRRRWHPQACSCIAPFQSGLLSCQVMQRQMAEQEVRVPIRPCRGGGRTDAVENLEHLIGYVGHPHR